MSTELGWLMSSYALMQLIFAPLWGIASDRFGRKPILAMGVLGYTVSSIPDRSRPKFHRAFPGSFALGHPFIRHHAHRHGYIGESTKQKEKSKGMGQLGAMAGIGVVLGPLMGGLHSTDSLSLPFFVGSEERS